MISRIQLSMTVKPGRMLDAIGQFNECNVIIQRLAGVTGQMFAVAFGDNCLGGTVLVYDFPSPTAQAAFETASSTDSEWLAFVARLVASDSPWVLPTPRVLLRQVV
jgi:hypothetical protein